MSKTILLAGQINKALVSQFKREIAGVGEIDLIINSAGGPIDSAMQLLDLLKEPGAPIVKSVKIYMAISSAAIIAPATNTDKIEVVAEAKFALHIGTICLQANELMGDRVPFRIVEELEEWKRIFFLTLDKFPKISARKTQALTTSGSVEFTPQELLEFDMALSIV